MVGVKKFFIKVGYIGIYSIIESKKNYLGCFGFFKRYVFFIVYIFRWFISVFMFVFVIGRRWSSESLF